MLSKTWTFAFASALAAAPLYSSPAAGSGNSVAGGVGDTGPDGSGSPRSTLGVGAPIGSETSGAGKMGSSTGSNGPSVGSGGTSGSAKSQKTGGSTSQ